MKIVIDIDENVFTRICDNSNEDYGIASYDIFEMAHSIRNGTLLPKGHGRLIDAGKLPVCAECRTPDGTSVYIPAVPILKIVNAPTIIEADKVE